jgi:hypothetical protein
MTLRERIAMAVCYILVFVPFLILILPDRAWAVVVEFLQ